MKFNRKSIVNLTIFDLMVMPLIKPLPIIISFFNVFYFYIISCVGNIFNAKVAVLWGLKFLLISSFLLNFIIGAISYDEILIYIHFPFLLFIFFVYYYYFRENLNSSSSVCEWLIFYLFFNFVMALIYLYDYKVYFSLRSFWTFNDSLKIPEEFSSLVRFTGILSDPNNAAIIFVAVTAFVVWNGCKGVLFNFLLLFICGFIVAATMSSSGVISYILLNVFFYGAVFFSNEIKFKTKIFLFSFFLLIFSLFYLLFFELMKEYKFLEILFDRFLTNDGGGRIQMIRHVFHEEAFFKIIFGGGGIVELGGEVIKPHLGPLSLLLNFGLVFCFIFIIYFFGYRPKKGVGEYIPVFFIFLGFLNNTGFIDFRFCLMAALIIASCHKFKAEYKL